MAASARGIKPGPKGLPCCRRFADRYRPRRQPRPPNDVHPQQYKKEDVILSGARPQLLPAEDELNPRVVEGPPEAACTHSARGLSAKGTRSRSGRSRPEAVQQPLAKRGLGAKRQPLLSSTRNNSRVPHSGARRFSAQQGGIASLPTRSKLRVPHIPGVGMWVSCKARPSCRPKNPLFLACHPERSERTPRLLFAPSTTTPSANINPAQQD
jgi:hypothetical protein